MTGLTQRVESRTRGDRPLRARRASMTGCTVRQAVAARMTAPPTMAQGPGRSPAKR